MSAAHGRIARLFARLDRPALITFVTGGDPSPEALPRVLDALVAGGADMIELGMPFSDPMADGPSIQAANRRALSAGTTLGRLLDALARWRPRAPDVPIVLMGYANPVFAMGVESFAARAAAAGADGVILVDVPPEEDSEIAPALAAHGLDFIRLVAPTTDDARLARVLEGASGFLYHVAVAGVTGQRSADETTIRDAVARLRRATNLPVAVGFGVRTPAQAAAVAAHADAVVVGSALVDLIGERGVNDPAPALEQAVRALARAVAGARPSRAA